MTASPAAPPAPRPTGRWTPKRVLVTRSAAEQPHGQEIVRRCDAAGVDEITLLSGDRLPSLRGEDERETYRQGKNTSAVTVAPASKLKLQPIPPSADWGVDLAAGC